MAHTLMFGDFTRKELDALRRITNPLHPAVSKVETALYNIEKSLDRLCADPQQIEIIKNYWVPIADNFGMWRVRYRIEDNLFAITDKKNYQLIFSLLKRKAKINKTFFETVKEIVSYHFKAKGLSHFTIQYRQKNIFGIYAKMGRKKQNINVISDFFAIRIIVQEVSDCYSALEIIHTLWPAYEHCFKDYIKHPKLNGYQTIHTVLYCLNGQMTEFQIRTKEMDEIAQFGPAHHGQYKAELRSSSS